MEDGYYPLGAKHDRDAPYNQKENPEREIEVTISTTLSKTVKIKTTNYEEYEGFTDYYNLEEDVCNQVILPNEFSKFFEKTLDYYPDLKRLKILSEIKKDLSNYDNWDLDELEIIEN